MKAFEITEAGKEALRSGKYKMVRPRGAGAINFRDQPTGQLTHTSSTPPTPL
jgi:hypothetical protein